SAAAGDNRCVCTVSFLIRFLPRYPTWAGRLAPGCVGIVFMELTGLRDISILPGLFLGGLAAGFLASGEINVTIRYDEAYKSATIYVQLGNWG
ncbi:MAG: hypothetical protein IKC61_03955, partial [Clostridia bacterium]|nr:hypothetical protein [Clostridia bacterium]